MMHKAFVAEASLAGKLNHPHIVDIYDAVVEPDRSYLVMEYVPGTTLDSALRRRPACCRSARWSRSSSSASARSSTRSSTASSTATSSRATSCCRSAARPRSATSARRSSSAWTHETTQIKGVGSPAYMSPEQIRMEKLTQQTDIYSLGVTMYRLLTGRLPFEASSHVALTYAILNIAAAAARRACAPTCRRCSTRS